MSVAEDLGKLIIMMNPYTGGSDSNMEPHTFVDAPALLDPSPPGSPSTSPPASPSTSPPEARRIWMEIDRHYAGDWNFKGQPHNINTALRIAYRWAKRDKAGNILCWITDYLLIGYEGSNGG